NTVWSIEQDKDGIFWIGTANGLIKYDGYSFNDLSLDPIYQSDIFHVRIREIIADKDGLIWIFSANGLNIYYPDRDRFFNISHDSLAGFNGIKMDASGSIWVFGEGFMASVKTEIRTDTVLTHWIPYTFPEHLSDMRINDMLKENDELYLLATSQGIYEMQLSETDDTTEFIYDSLLPDIPANRILKHNDIIWIGTSSGLYKTVLDGKKLHYINEYHPVSSDPNSLISGDIRSLLIGPEDRLWIGTWGGGLSAYNNEQNVFNNFLFDPRQEDGISSSTIYCLHKDPFDIIWIGTAQGGLSKLDLAKKQFNNLVHNPYDEKTIPGNLINSVLEDSEGYLWIASYEDPLCRSNEKISEEGINNLSFRRFNRWHNSFEDKNILSIHEDDHGYIWLGYDHSVVVYNRFQDTFTEITFDLNGNTLPNELSKVNFIGNIDDERILIGGNQIIILKNPWQFFSSGRFKNIPAYIHSNNTVVITAEIESPEKIWIGYYNQGLAQYQMRDDSLVRVAEYAYSVNNDAWAPNTSVFSILHDNEQRLWVGSFGSGLNQMIYDNQDDRSSGRLKKLVLDDNVIYGIIEENDTILWLSTDLGICKINTNSLESTRFKMADGIVSNNFRKNAYHRGRSGLYYFGGLNGLTMFEPEKIKPNLLPPEIKLTALKINDKSITPSQAINKRSRLEKPISETSILKLVRSDRTVAIDVIVMHTASPEKNSFSYILEDFDDDWRSINSGSFTLNYTNLPLGKYKLRIMGYNGDGIPSEKETVLDIVMLAPWYATIFSKILFVLLGISLVAGIAIYFIKLQNLQNTLHFEKLDKERITAINMAKLRFFTNISHEFRTPLALISIPLQKLHDLIQDREQRKYLEAAEKNTSKLIRLIDQLLTFRRIEQGKLDLKYSLSTLDDFLYPIVEAFEGLSNKKEIEFHYLVKDPELNFASDLEKMEQVLYNLLSNAFKYTPLGGRVTLEGRSTVIEHKKYVSFEIRDTGKGIHQKDIKLIFDRFYQSDSELRNMGTGIGLSLCKSIVELHNGIIQVESKQKTGTSFMVHIPYIKDGPAEIKEIEVNRMDPLKLLEFEELTTNTVTITHKQGDTHGTILIVDDEEDFRKAILDIFRNKFRILEAMNGKEALEIARTDNPDLIISDVRMPVMNGYDLCNNIKTDIELCHIPFILLTALEEMENHIQGMEFGADLYISKPFNLKYLEVSVKKLIDNRKKILEHFKRTSNVLPKNIKISGIDREFIERINEAIQQNLDNSTFGVAELAAEVNISPSYFYRKLKLLTGQIPNEYIRNYRLQMAADLFTNNPGINVKTVMYEVGFESASHFSHAFKKKYDVSPSDYNP
ncbi:two-component regulator propeller domain-containing protein, partial [Bacteroidota bacterium]